MNNEKLISALRSCLALGSRCEDCPLDGDYQKCKIDTLAADALEAADAKMHEQDLRIADLVMALNAEQAKVARLVTENREIRQTHYSAAAVREMMERDAT